MFKYELVLLLPAKEELETVKKMISDNGATIEEEKSWGEKKLAYKIKKYHTAYYHLLNIAIKKKSLLARLKQQLNFSEKIIRYLLLVLNK